MVFTTSLLTVDEVAQKLRLPRAGVYALIRECRLPGIVHVGRLIRIREADLLHWIENGGAALPGGWKREAI